MAQHVIYAVCDRHWFYRHLSLRQFPFSKYAGRVPDAFTLEFPPLNAWAEHEFLPKRIRRASFRQSNANSISHTGRGNDLY